MNLEYNAVPRSPGHASAGGKPETNFLLCSRTRASAPSCFSSTCPPPFCSHNSQFSVGPQTSPPLSSAACLAAVSGRGVPGGRGSPTDACVARGVFEPLPLTTRGPAPGAPAQVGYFKGKAALARRRQTRMEPRDFSIWPLRKQRLSECHQAPARTLPTAAAGQTPRALAQARRPRTRHWHPPA